MNNFKKHVFAVTTFFFFYIFSFGQVYQLPNGGFENWDSNSEPSNWNAFPSARCDISIGCSSATKTRHEVSSDVHLGSFGTHSCKIYATKVKIATIEVIANGVMTTGQVRIGSSTAASPENYNYSKISDNSLSQVFNGKPDSLVFWAKFVCPNEDQSARVSATIHDNYDFRDPMDSDEGSYSHRVATAIKNFKRGDQLWTRHSVPFDYIGPSSNPQYILITFTTNRVQGAGSENDQLFIDDVEMIYNTKLSNIKVDGFSISDFNPDTLDYFVEIPCFKQPIVEAESCSSGAEIDIVQANNADVAIISVTNGNKSSQYSVHFNRVHIVDVVDDICQGNAYENYGFSLPIQNQVGTFVHRLIYYESDGCDSITELTLNVRPSYLNDTIDFMVCNSGEYNFFGRRLTEPGIYDTTFKTQYGCDSTVVLKLSVGEYYRELINASICDGDIYSFHGFNNITEGSDTIIYHLTQSDCDSLVILNLSVNPSFRITIFDSIYAGNEYVKNGFDFPAFDSEIKNIIEIDSSLYFQTALGCDSIVNLKLKIMPIPFDSTFFDKVKFKIGPIPTMDKLNIISSMRVAIDLPFTIFDVNGRALRSGFICSDNANIDLTGLGKGIYYLQIVISEKRKETFKVMIEREVLMN